MRLKSRPKNTHRRSEGRETTGFHISYECYKTLTSFAINRSKHRQTSCIIMSSTRGNTGKNCSVFPKSYGSTTYNAFEKAATPYSTFYQSFLNYKLHEHIISCR